LGTIRDFLRAERREPPPWASPRRAVDELYDLLRQRRGDDLFWLRLEDLTSRLADSRFSSAALARSEAIDGATADRLLADLRSSLGGGDASPRSIRDWMGSKMSAAALTGFLLLGTATGCAEDDDDDNGGGGGGGGLCQDAIDEELSGEEGEVYCDLIDIVESADVSSSVKQDILDCLPELDADYREFLLEQFQGMSEQQLAEYLEDMVSWNGVCSSDGDSDTH
jgi:hypothetical protein